MNGRARRHGARGFAAAAVVALMLVVTTATASAAVTLTQASSPPPTDEFAEIPGLDWSRFGYEWSEFYIAGDAHSYHPTGSFLADGAWTVEPDLATAPFKARLRVLKPSDPSCFNGTVYVEWLNVTALQDAAPSLGYAHDEVTRQCAAYVGVSAQSVGVSHLVAQYPSR
jgi:Alpha/beta hydrolase domain